MVDGPKQVPLPKQYITLFVRPTYNPMELKPLPLTKFLKLDLPIPVLYILAHHGNHKVEEADSFNESEPQNGIGEKLSSDAWVPGNSG